MMAAEEDLAKRIVDLANRKDMTVYQTVNDILEQALRVEEMGLSMRQVVDERWMLERAREIGLTFTVERLLYEVVEAAYEEASEDHAELWREMGRWYGKYFQNKNRDPVETFSEAMQLLTYGTTEFSLSNEGRNLSVSCVGERYTEGFTEVFSVFIESVLESLGYSLTEKETSKGIIKLQLKPAG